MGNATARATILVVDDDRLVLATLVHGLVQAGYHVIDADNGDDAILLAREHRPDLALLDIRMEGKSGFDVAAYLREVGQTPFVFLSAFSDDQTMAQVQALGALAYLVKPLDIARLVPAVEAALARRRGPSPPAPGGPSLDVAAAAVGVLMHRYSLPRAAAIERLQRLAADEGVSAVEQAERLLQAVEQLSPR